MTCLARDFGLLVKSITPDVSEDDTHLVVTYYLRRCFFFEITFCYFRDFRKSVFFLQGTFYEIFFLRDVFSIYLFLQDIFFRYVFILPDLISSKHFLRDVFTPQDFFFSSLFPSGPSSRHRNLAPNSNAGHSNQFHRDPCKQRRALKTEYSGDPSSKIKQGP